MVSWHDALHLPSDLEDHTSRFVTQDTRARRGGIIQGIQVTVANPGGLDLNEDFVWPRPSQVNRVNLEGLLCIRHQGRCNFHSFTQIDLVLV